MFHIFKENSKMKKLYTMVLAAALVGTFTSCDDFLDYTPTAVVDEDKAFSEPDKMVNSAYAMLGDCWYSYPFNLWPYGDLSSDDCLKGGGGTGDTGYHDVEIWSTLTSTKGELDELWYRLYCAVSRCNRALVSLQRNGESTLGAEVTKQREAEVRFLRAHFYFKLLSMYRQIPWIDEKVYEDKATESTSNTQFTYEELWQKVIADFQTAYDVLPAKQKDGGRVNKIAAAGYLAKCYLTIAWGDGYEATDGVDHINKEYMQKVVEYTDVVKNSDYGYMADFGDIFLPDNKNSKESVFAVQASDYSEDHTTFGRGNWSNVLNGCWGMWSCGWDFHKPSQDLVNAFKTKNGLPEFDDYNKHIDYPINGKPNNQKWDPRLFHTVGMPTFPYKYEKEYTLTKANSRTPNTYGYYCSMKEVPQRSKGETYNGSWQAFAMNDYVFRYSDVMLMRAEALIETDQLMEARDIINAYDTSADTIETGKAIAKGFGKEFVTVTDVPMFIANRVMCPMMNEAAILAGENVCSYEDIDKACELGYNLPMGPLKLADAIGIDIMISVMESLYQETADSKYRPAHLYKVLYRAGRLGRKSGKGFYDYTK